MDLKRKFRSSIETREKSESVDAYGSAIQCVSTLTQMMLDNAHVFDRVMNDDPMPYNDCVTLCNIRSRYTRAQPLINDALDKVTKVLSFKPSPRNRGSAPQTAHDAKFLLLDMANNVYLAHECAVDDWDHHVATIQDIDVCLQLLFTALSNNQ